MLASPDAAERLDAAETIADGAAWQGRWVAKSGWASVVSLSRRALVVINAARWGGLHAMFARIAPILGVDGWEFLIIVPKDGVAAAERLRKHGVRVVLLDIGRPRASWSWSDHRKFLRALIADQRVIADLVAQERISAAILPGIHNVHIACAIWLSGCPVVWQIHSDILRPVFRVPLMLLARLFGSGFMLNGNVIRRKFPFVPKSPLRATVFYPALDEHWFNGTGGAVEPDDKSYIRVGALGSRTHVKGHDLFVKMAVLCSHENDRLLFSVCGPDVPGHERAYQKDVVALACQEGLIDSGRLRFYEGTEDVREFLDNLDIFVLPSRAEGMPLVVAEAMSRGLPVVATDVGGVSEMIQDGCSGFLIASGDAAGMASAVLRLAENSELRRTVGHSAKVRAHSLFGAQRSAEAHKSALKKLRLSRLD